MRNPALRPQPCGARPSVSNEHEMFGTQQQAVFSAARNVVRSRKQLARKGRKAPPESSLFQRARDAPAQEFLLTGGIVKIEQA